MELSWRGRSHARARAVSWEVEPFAVNGTNATGPAPENATTTTTTLPAWSEWRGDESIGHPSSSFNAGSSLGVALHGWLHLEEWFFSDGRSSNVAAGLTDENGVSFPPMFPDQKSLGFAWASEGDLVNKLVKHYGTRTAAHSFAAHRAQYVTDDDLLEIASKGIELVRIPMSWSLFARDPATVARGAERVLIDPVYPDRLFVNMAGADLDHVIERCRNAGLKVLIDLHNMPGGAAAGSYNGVFPHPPLMFSRDDLSRTGLLVVRNMLKWFKALPVESRLAVHGIQLLNEPGHALQEQRGNILRWLASAIQMYKEEIINERGISDAERVPFLYVNLIETMGLNVADMAAWMRSQFTVKELETWAVLDVHHYFAWSYNGCDTGCSFGCGDRPSVISQRVGEEAGAWAAALRESAKKFGVQHVAVSEWSLATFYDSTRSCRDKEILDIMFERQEEAFRGAGIQSFFWGWKMPYGGSHVKAWSLKDYLTGHKEAVPPHEIVPQGFTLQNTLALPEGATKEDEERLIRAYSQFPDATAGDAKDSPDTLKIQASDMVKLLQQVAQNTQNTQNTASVGNNVHRKFGGAVSAEAAADDYLRASSKLKEMIDLGEYSDDDDTEVVLVRRARSADATTRIPDQAPIRVDGQKPDAQPEVNVSSVSENTTSSVGASAAIEGTFDSLIDTSKIRPPSPPPAPPIPSPPPPGPPSKRVVEAQRSAANALSELDLSTSSPDVSDETELLASLAL